MVGWSRNPRERVRMVLMVDTGLDDALALALAVRHPLIDLAAVLTSWGNIGLELVTDNTLRVLDWLGATTTPVLSGSPAPLVGPLVDAGHFHGQDGLGGARLPASQRSAPAGAVGYLIEQLTTQPGQISVVCTGPLTDLALAVQRQPRVVECVREVVLMGGAAQLPGNVTPVAEFNIFADPEAAAIVFDQSWPLTMVGLDVTQQVVLTREDIQRLAGDSSPEAVLIHEVTRYLFETRGMDAMALHDPLAVAVAVDPALVTTASGAVHVETRGEFTRGQTVFDFRAHAPHVESRTRVSLEVDVDGFRQMFFTTLGLPPR